MGQRRLDDLRNLWCILSVPRKEKGEATTMLFPQSLYYTSQILLYKSISYHFMTRRILRDLRHPCLGSVQSVLELKYVLGLEHRPQI
ncbi:hypothetical protein PKDLPJHF_02638 [Aeromonas veronii]